VPGRVLVAVSSVGLGHAARARVYGSLLESMGFSVDYYAPEPAGSYLRAWGGRVLPVSWEVESLSVYLERHWAKTGSGLIGLRAALEEHRAALAAGRQLLASVDVDSYDLVVAEESWEIISLAEEIGAAKAWIADFVGYKPLGLRQVPAAWAVNRFLLRRYRHFDHRIYVGLPAGAGELSWRLTPRGPTALEVLESLFHRAGPIPAFLPGEEASRREARRALGLPGEPRVILVQLGGTRAGERLAEAAARAALEEGLTPAVARGPRASPRIPEGAVDLGYAPRLPALLQAFDCAYTLAGLSTIASLAAAGVPAALAPLPGHFEQEENARRAPRLWRGLFVDASTMSPRDAVRAACSLPGRPPDAGLHSNSRRVASILAAAASGVSK